MNIQGIKNLIDKVHGLDQELERYNELLAGMISDELEPMNMVLSFSRVSEDDKRPVLNSEGDLINHKLQDSEKVMNLADIFKKYGMADTFAGTNTSVSTSCSESINMTVTERQTFEILAILIRAAEDQRKLLIKHLESKGIKID